LALKSRFTQEVIQLGNQYYKMPFKNFKKDVPKAHSPIVAAILFLIDLLMLS